MKKKLKVFILLTCTLALMTACGSNEQDMETGDMVTVVDESVEKTEDESETENITKTETPEIEGYNLLWSDEFDEDELDVNKWNREPREPGWTNEELQEYTTITDNIFVRDGKLVLKAIKTKDENGSDYYTSGKVTGQNKTDFMYGKVVVSAKTPEGQGLWPAIWMMPTDEDYYGQWPKCGEIDIMEVLGNQTHIAYGTVHYGEPHAEQQGIYTLDNGSFSEDFHEYSVEWEPGEMRFYIDGNHYHTVNDWFTRVEGEEEKPYPAPFDQTFFVQMNLAVGGTWPGDPDETTDFDNAEFMIDYVRVYQKPSYDTNVEKPETNFRQLTEDGNLIHNGDFSQVEPLDDDENWSFLLFEGGEGSARIEDGEIIITSEQMGTAEYSVQLVQADLPMMEGTNYRLTFDAWAAEEREMITCVSAPTGGWIRYLEDTSLELTNDWQTYTYDFEVTQRDDNNGRLEFNMGAQDSTAEIRIKNIRIEIID